MKKILLSIIVTAALASNIEAQTKELRRNSWGIDHEKHIIVTNDKSSKNATTLLLDDIYTLNEPLEKGKAISATNSKGDNYTIYLSNMPIININTDSEIVNSPAVHGTITVDDGNTSITMHAGFKIRGTSSQQYDKKSYRIELWNDASGTATIDTSFLGLRSDDDWNLEAMANQPLLLRDKTANELWQEIYTLPYLDSINSTNAHPGIRMKYVDLYINNSYLGVYTLTERIDRKQLGLRKYSTKIRGLLVKGNGNGAPSFETLPAYSNESDTWDNFEWVYPNEADSIIDWSGLYSLVNFTINASDNVFNTQYASMFDADNIIDYFLFINVMGAADNMARNIFLARYKKSSTYFYVPWDLDAILGIDNDGNSNPSTTGLRSNGLYDRLLGNCSSGNFTDLMQQRYTTLRNSQLSHGYIMDKVNEQYTYLNDNGAYARESEVWEGFNASETDIEYIDNWLNNRLNYLDTKLLEDCATWNIDENTTLTRIKVYPKPTNSILNIDIEQPDNEVIIYLYDIMGRVMFQTTTSQGHVQIATGALPTGIYTLNIISGEWQETDKIVVER